MKYSNIMFVLFVKNLFPCKRNRKVTTQTKALNEYMLMVLFVLLLKRCHFLANETYRCDHLNDNHQRQIKCLDGT